LAEDLIIQNFPLDTQPEKIWIAPATAFFQTTGLPREN